MEKTIIIRHSLPLTHYLPNVYDTPLPSHEGLMQLVRQYQEGEDVFPKLRTIMLRFVASVAKQYVDKGLTFDELLEEGYKGLENAVRRYDEKRGFKFIPYAVWWIRQRILQTINE